MDKLPEKLVFSVNNITEYASSGPVVRLSAISQPAVASDNHQSMLAMDAQPLYLQVAQAEVAWWRARLGKRVGFQPVDL